jgi:cellulose synthase operon protein YhjQ
MTKITVDDVESLCEHVRLEPLAYKQFPRRGRQSLGPQPDWPSKRRDSPSGRDGAAGDRKHASFELPSASLAGDSERWLGLRALTANSRDARAGGLVRQTDLAVFSACGGAGGTTVIATLGRIFSKRRNSVLLLDGSAPSILPFYFGSRATRVGSCSHMELREETGGAVHVVSPHGAESDWLSSGIARAQGSFHRVLADATSGIPVDPGLDGIGDLFADSKALVVIVPDMRCAVEIPRILDSYRASEQRSGVPGRVHFVLNNFDAGLPLHVEMRARFTSQLGAKLLPFAIQRSEHVSEAVAEGLTVVDYAPDSAVAEDFLRLALWVETESVCEPLALQGTAR